MDKKPLIICNPPITFATNLKTHYGHLFYSTILDISARFRKDFLKERVYFPSRTYNICGKPSEKLMKEKRLTVLKFKKFFKKELDKDWKIRDINLSNSDIIIDKSKTVENEMKKLLKTLWNKRKITKREGNLYLNLNPTNCADFKNKLKKLKIFPEFYKKTLLFHLEAGKKELCVTRNRKYSLPTGLSSRPLAPFFIVSNFWDAYFPKSEFILVCTPNLIIKSILFRAQVHYLAYGKLEINSAIIFPKIYSPLLNPKQIVFLSKNRIRKDVLRLSLSNDFSLKKSRTQTIDKSCEFGIAFMKKLLLVVKKTDWSKKSKKRLKLKEYISLMSKYKYKEVLNKLINYMDLCIKRGGNISKEEFEDLLEYISPFTPHISYIIKNSDDKLSCYDILLKELKKIEEKVR